LPFDHVDAGVALALQQGAQDDAAALLIRSHHAPGLPSILKEDCRKNFRYRGERHGGDHDSVHQELVERNNAQLDELEKAHRNSLDGNSHPFQRSTPTHGIAARIALSCLVDSDHSDAGRFDKFGAGSPAPKEETNPRWSDRLEALKNYIQLQQDAGRGEPERNRMRQVFFEGCLEHPLQKDQIFSCEASVGLGKTTSVLAYLLRQAIENNLRRIVIVAPFTNILRQTARTLAKALLLPSESPEDVILQHHHRADFSSEELRDLATTWDSPIILTTAVQFFETLGSNHPSSLRKIHRLPGSGIFIDEAHAALPFDLWPQCFEWLRELATNWSCPTALVSGSQVRFWEQEWGRPHKKKSLSIPDITPSEVAAFSADQEALRCKITNHQAPLTSKDLGALVKTNLDRGRNQLVILNTVHSAAGFAKEMSASLDQQDSKNLKTLRVLHLSTLLTPLHRERILIEIERREKDENFGFSWVLVATSCVEAGVDLDFHDGFREDSSMSSLIQTSGRINRNGLFENSVLTRITLATDPNFRPHPQFVTSAKIVGDLFPFVEEGKHSLSDIATAAVSRELEAINPSPRLKEISLAERDNDYPKVAELCRVIQSDTMLVLADENMAKKLKKGVPIDKRTLIDNSIQIWGSKLKTLGLESFISKSGHLELHLASEASYDEILLGLGKGVLTASKNISNFCII